MTSSDSPSTPAIEGGEYRVLQTAMFDGRLRLYWLFQVALVMLVSVIGIILLPFWLLGIGQLWTRKLFESMEAELTERSLNYRKGLFFKVEKTIPLEQIQDLTIHEGPFLKALGICSLAVETAGQNTAGGGVARLTGIQDARDFRNAVLTRRDLLKAGDWGGSSPNQNRTATAADGGDLDKVVGLLTEIRDQLAVMSTRSGTD